MLAPLLPLLPLLPPLPPLPPPASDDPAANATAVLSLDRALVAGDTLAIALLLGLEIAIRKLQSLNRSPVPVQFTLIMSGMSTRRPLADI